MPNTQTEEARVRERADGMRLRMERFEKSDGVTYGFSRLVICCIPDLAAAEAWLDEWKEAVRQTEAAVKLGEQDDQREHSNGGGEGRAKGPEQNGQ